MKSRKLTMTLSSLLLLAPMTMGCVTSGDNKDDDKDTSVQADTGLTDTTGDAESTEVGLSPDATAHETSEAGATEIDSGPAAGPALSTAEIERRAAFLASDDLAGRAPGTPGGEAARAYLIDELSACGIAPLDGESYEQPIAGGNGVNLLGLIPGSDPTRADRHVLLSAHFDHIGWCDGAICNGADDNAAAVAIVVEIACALVDTPPPRSVIVALWDSEEPPNFLTAQMGSEYYAANPIVPLAQTDVALVLDLVGSDLWPGYLGHFVLGGELSPSIYEAVQSTEVPEGLTVHQLGIHAVEETVTGFQPWSDYNGFRNRDVPFLFFSNGQNKRYHTPHDEFVHLNLTKMASEAHFLAELVDTLTHASETPTWKPGGQRYADELTVCIAVLQVALAPGGIVDSLDLSDASSDALQADLDNALAIEAGTQSADQTVTVVRAIVQRLMCLAGSSYPEALCSLF